MAETIFKMPKMGESITEGTILNWLVQEGESFDEGDILVEVATDKVDNEVPAPSAGILISHSVSAKDVVPVGETIAILELSDVASAKMPQTEKMPKKGSSVISEKKQKKTTTSSSKAFKVNENLFISPLVDAIARKNHISYEELARIIGTGKDGRLRKSDVTNYLNEGRPLQFAQAVAEPSGFQIPDLKFDKGTGEIVEMDRMREMIADHMVYSKHTSPHVTAYVEADLTDMVNWRNANKLKFQEKHNERFTIGFA